MFLCFVSDGTMLFINNGALIRSLLMVSAPCSLSPNMLLVELLFVGHYVENKHIGLIHTVMSQATQIGNRTVHVAFR